VTRPRILFTITEFPPIIGGISTLAEVLLEELKKGEEEFHLWAPPGTQAPAGVILHATYRRPSGYLPRAFLEVLNALELRRLLTTHDFQRVLFMDASARAYAFGFVPEVPALVYAHGLEVRSEGRFRDWTTGKLWLQKRAMRRAGLVGTNSNSTRDQTRQVCPGPVVETVYPSFDRRRVFHPEEHSQSPYPDGPFHFLTVARLVDRKDHARVLNLLATLDSLGVSDWNYHVVGDGPLRVPLEKRCEQLGLRDRVVFWGNVPAERLGAFYHHADLFIMLSKWVARGVEGFGLVFVEAGRSDLATVGSRHGGVVEAIEDGVTGIILSDHHDQAARQLIELMNDAPRRLALSQAGRKRAEEFFSPEAFGARIRALANL